MDSKAILPHPGKWTLGAYEHAIVKCPCMWSSALAQGLTARLVNVPQEPDQDKDDLSPTHETTAGPPQQATKRARLNGHDTASVGSAGLSRQPLAPRQQQRTDASRPAGAGTVVRRLRNGEKDLERNVLICGTAMAAEENHETTDAVAGVPPTAATSAVAPLASGLAHDPIVLVDTPPRMSARAAAQRRLPRQAATSMTGCS